MKPIKDFTVADIQALEHKDTPPEPSAPTLPPSEWLYIESQYRSPDRHVDTRVDCSVEHYITPPIRQHGRMFTAWQIDSGQMVVLHETSIIHRPYATTTT
jgi:hypothetical protein